ncbi:hypothetical protein GCM10027515_10000 [Schumannella luteola]|uniref:Uncharacterized protein n=1 Tax=Schumannella luteola TaxID=472059 RepID=A0A852YI48_9MICO|nr:hypothetical protein [Schumannella luteola]NYG97449.1 hypothetical protein [Schumannella luteola]TPX05869.1 hypothetical protein FJ656_03990 [Schumannella luteola]
MSISSAQLARDRAVGRIAAVAFAVVVGCGVLVGPIGSTIGGVAGLGPLPWPFFLAVALSFGVLTVVTWAPGRRNVGTRAQGRVLLGISPGLVAFAAVSWGLICFLTAGRVPIGVSGSPYAVTALIGLGIGILAGARTKSPTPKPPPPVRRRVLTKLPRFAFDRFTVPTAGFSLDAPAEWIEVQRLARPEPWVAHVVGEIEQAQPAGFTDAERAAVTAALAAACARCAAEGVDGFLAFAGWDAPVLVTARRVAGEQRRGLDPAGWVEAAAGRAPGRVNSFTTRSGIRGVSSYRSVPPHPAPAAPATPDVPIASPARADFAFQVDDEIYALSLVAESRAQLNEVLDDVRRLVRCVDHGSVATQRGAARAPKRASRPRRKPGAEPSS